MYSVTTDVLHLRVDNVALLFRGDTPTHSPEVCLQLVCIINISKFVELWQVGVLSFEAL
jgi:hypothetical protein